jgi:hypothetical protein
MRDPDKIIKVEYGDRTFFALLMFALAIFLCIIIYFRVSSDNELIHEQQHLLEVKSEQIESYINQINEMNKLVSFTAGRLSEQTSLLNLASELEKQKRLFEELAIPDEYRK